MASDAELVLAVRRGSQSAREVLFRRHVQAVYAISQQLAGGFADPRLLTEDTFRQAFFRLGFLEHSFSAPSLPAPRFGTTPAPVLIHGDTFRAWLGGLSIRVIEKAAGKALRRARLRAWLHLGDSNALGRLPFRAQAACVLSQGTFGGRLDVADIALALDTRVSQVRRWLRRAVES